MLGMSDINIVLILAAFAAVLMAFEVFTPSFGLLTLCAVITAGIALFFAFRIGQFAGWILIFCIIAFVPLYFYVLVHIMPETPIGKRLLLKKGRKADSQAAPLKDELAELVGKAGTAATTLRPVGVIKIDGRRYDARAEQGLIEQGQNITVVSAGGTDVVVREV